MVPRLALSLSDHSARVRQSGAQRARLCRFVSHTQDRRPGHLQVLARVHAQRLVSLPRLNRHVRLVLAALLLVRSRSLHPLPSMHSRHVRHTHVIFLLQSARRGNRARPLGARDAAPLRALQGLSSTVRGRVALVRRVRGDQLAGAVLDVAQERRAVLQSDHGLARPILQHASVCRKRPRKSCQLRVLFAARLDHARARDRPQRAHRRQGALVSHKHEQCGLAQPRPARSDARVGAQAHAHDRLLVGAVHLLAPGHLCRLVVLLGQLRLGVQELAAVLLLAESVAQALQHLLHHLLLQRLVSARLQENLRKQCLSVQTFFF